MNAVAEARQKRTSPAVILKKALDIREADPESKIAIIEGKDDTGVWPVWIERVYSNLEVEPIPAGGKRNVLEVRKSIHRNRHVSEKFIVFIVDKDFDENDYVLNCVDVFCTDRYSIENYFITDRVIDSILNIYFSCPGDVRTKERTRVLFESFMEAYKAASAETHFRAFSARRLKISGVSFPKKFSEIVQVGGGLDVSKPNDENIKISLQGIPEADTIELRDEFSRMSFLHDWRGKFHLLALKFFLQYLQSEKEFSEDRTVFPKEKSSTDFKYSELRLSEFAVYSDLPANFDEFLQVNFSQGNSS